MAACLACLLGLLMSGGVAEHVATAGSVLATCGLLYLSGRSETSGPLLGNKPFAFIGRISFSLYLWHWPVAVFGKILVPDAWALAFYVLATTVLSLSSYYLVERPLRTQAWTWSGERFALAYPAYLAVMAAVLGGIWLARGRLYQGPAEVQERPALSGSACHIPNSSGLDRCLRATMDGVGTLWLIGDSHAGNLAGGLRAAAAAIGMRFQFLTGTSLFLSLQGKCSAAACPEGDHVALARHLRKVSRPGDAILIGFARDRFEDGRVDARLFARNLSSMVELLGADDRAIVFVEDIPKVCAGQREYFQSALGWPSCTVSSKVSRRQRAPLSAIYQEVGGLHRATILDPHDELCEGDDDGELRCGNFLGGKAIYLDPSPHLTAAASASLERFFAAGLEPVLSIARPRRGQD